MITEVTRKAIVELFKKFNPDEFGVLALMSLREAGKVGISWWGDLDEIDFLKRLFKLDQMPSEGERFENVEGDIYQHRYNNNDWQDDWIFYDNRFELNSNDKKLFEFLAETIHPAVRADKNEVIRIKDELNLLLAPDLYALKQIELISGRPVFKVVPIERRKVTSQMIHEQISYAISSLKAYNVASYCDSLELPKADEDIKPMQSKAVYVRHRLTTLNKDQSIKVARKVIEEFDFQPLIDLVNELDTNGLNAVPGAVKNLIFASNGPKPDLYLSDAINNDVMVHKNGEYVLVYDEEIDSNQGLSWNDLLQWWMKKENNSDKESANHDLFIRLRDTCNKPETMIFDAYGRLLKERGFHLPALLPQIWLHYDPISAAQRGDNAPLTRQRMDFLMLMPGKVRIVIELDGKQHYSDDKGYAKPKLYASMMEEDRKLHFAGYQVFRFGGNDFIDDTIANKVMTEFFEELLLKSGLK